MIHLNHASQAILPAVSAEAAKAIYDRYATEGSLPIPFWESILDKARARAAKLLGVDASTVVFIPNTTGGVHLAMQLIPFRDGDRVLVVGAFPALLAPWKFSGVNGVEAVFVEWDDQSTVIAQIQANLSRSDFQAVFVDWVHFATGKALDLHRLGKLVHGHNALLIVDAIQGLGVLPSPALSVDMLFAGSAKWLLGPEGIGLCYLNPNQTWNSGPVGWLSADYEGFTSVMPPRPPRSDARRIEAGTRNLAGIAAFSKSLEILLNAGDIWPRVFTLVELLIQGAHARGLLTSVQKPESGIVGIEGPHPESVTTALGERGIRVSARERWIRVSPHFFNTPAEIGTFFLTLDEVLNSS
jgi:cysteine desulfurase/selenocysteine lyase